MVDDLAIGAQVVTLIGLIGVAIRFLLTAFDKATEARTPGVWEERTWRAERYLHDLDAHIDVLRDLLAEHGVDPPPRPARPPNGLP